MPPLLSTSDILHEETERQKTAAEIANLREKSKQAHAAALAEASAVMMKEGQAAVEELEATLAGDLTALEPEELRKKVVKLTLQLRQRHEAEAARLESVIRRAQVGAGERIAALQSSMENKYEELSLRKLQRQAEELKAQAAWQLVQRERELLLAQERAVEARAKEVQEAMAREAETIKQAAKNEAEAELSAARQSEIEIEQRGLEERMRHLESLSARVEAIGRVLDSGSDYRRLSHRLHRVSSALFAVLEAADHNDAYGAYYFEKDDGDNLNNNLNNNNNHNHTHNYGGRESGKENEKEGEGKKNENNKKNKKENSSSSSSSSNSSSRMNLSESIAALKVASRGDDVVDTVLASIPPGALAPPGIPTIPQLQRRCELR